MTTLAVFPYKGFTIHQASDGLFYIDNTSFFKRSGYVSLRAAKTAITKQSQHVANVKKKGDEAAALLGDLGITLRK
jgi:hypothetical protein